MQLANSWSVIGMTEELVEPEAAQFAAEAPAVLRAGQPHRQSAAGRRIEQHHFRQQAARQPERVDPAAVGLGMPPRCQHPGQARMAGGGSGVECHVPLRGPPDSLIFRHILRSSRCGGYAGPGHPD